VRRVPGVEAVQGRSTAVGRIQVGDRWLTLNLVVYDPLADLHINKLAPETAAWPPPERAILLERSSAFVFGDGRLPMMVTIQPPAGHRVALPVAGTVHDLTVLPTSVTGDVVYAYVTRNTLAWLGEQRDFSELLLTVADDKLDVGHIRQVTHS
jgi:putative ABC transport system permease protein